LEGRAACASRLREPSLRSRLSQFVRSPPCRGTDSGPNRPDTQPRGGPLSAERPAGWCVSASVERHTAEDAFMKGSLDGAHRRRCSRTGMVAVPVLGALLATTCTAGDVPETSLARARQVGLRVGFSIEPPFAFVDSAGEPRGEAP